MEKLWHLLFVSAPMSNVNYYTLNTKIPFVIFIRKGVKFKDHYHIKASTQLSICGISISGFSCGKNKYNSCMSAIGELYERIWSNLIVQSSIKTSQVAIINLATNLQQGELSIRELINGLHCKNYIIPSDATGISYHSSLKKALSHSLMEYVERMILFDFWHGDIKLFAYKNHEDEDEDESYKLEFYLHDVIPFCLAVLRTNTSIIFGAKVSNNYQSAITGAQNEAIMVYEDYFSSEIKKSPPSRHEKLLNEMSNESYIKSIISYIENNTIKNKIHHFTNLNSYATITDIMITLKACCFYYAKIPSKWGVCTRVFSNRSVDLRLPNRLALNIPFL